MGTLRKTVLVQCADDTEIVADAERNREVRPVPVRNEARIEELFDAKWYAACHNVEVADAYSHYLRHGVSEGASPNPLFDVAFYGAQFPDVDFRVVNPIEHYLGIDPADRVNTHALFDRKFYAAQTPALAADVDPLAHFVNDPQARLRSPHPLFDPLFYLEKYPDLAQKNIYPIVHYLKAGEQALRHPHPLFDPDWCLSQAKDAEARRAPLQHFLTKGSAARLSPHPLFDPEYYLLQTDDPAARVSPAIHFLLVGARQGLDPHPLFDTKFYRASGAALPEGMNPVLHCLTDPDGRLRPPHPLFDPKFYLAVHPDLAEANVHPLLHYIRAGGRETRRPHPVFDVRWYRKQCEDAEQRANPVVHYLTKGARRGLSPHPLFDPLWYLSQTDDPQARKAPLAHYLRTGWAAGLTPHLLFDSQWYRRTQLDPSLEDVEPLSHFLTDGDRAGLDPNPLFSTAWYRARSPDIEKTGQNALVHYVVSGGAERRDPHPAFSTEEHLRRNPEALQTNESALAHALLHDPEGSDRVGALSEVYLRLQRRLEAASPSGAGAPFAQCVTQDRKEGRVATAPEDSFKSAEYIAIERDFDADFYRKQFGRDEFVPADLVQHYLTEGVQRGLDPCAWFSTSYYLGHYPDVAAAGVNPFAHFLTQGRQERRLAAPPQGDSPETAGSASGTRDRSSDIFAERQKYCEPGEAFEEFDPLIVRVRKPAVKALAYYLPQFHPIEQNDAWWGKGFTEWRNVARGQSRFKGHYQPRTPRDLGYYDLRRAGVMREQAALAKAAGIFGFCFYYYFFNGRRLLEQPIDAFLNDGAIDMPFALMWANENWTRTWDGHDNEILISQDYRSEDEDALVADLARHFADARYIRIDGRPLLFIYRPSLIKESAAAIARWREKFEARHGEKPLIFMAQGFDDLDPRRHGLDGAIEFPPHKICANLPAINRQLDILDPDFAGHVIDYAAAVRRSIDERAPEFPLIKTATPSWDNESRRPGRGMTLHGGDPHSYGEWLSKLVDFATENPVFGQHFVAINAWNEWAEGSYLEPDVYYGAAYLNATARALTRSPALLARLNKILIIGHDAYRHGAQLLVQNMATVIARQFGADVSILVCGDGPLLNEYQKICDTLVVVRGDQASLQRTLKNLWDEGYRAAIVNTTVSGWAVPSLTAQGFAVCTLVHELKTLIQEYSLEKNVAAIADGSDAVVFPAGMVRDSFLDIAGELKGEEVIRPQGLYKLELASGGPSRAEARARLGIADSDKVIINVGYADARKGFDIFARAAQELRRTRDDMLFLWVGDATLDVKRWLLPDMLTGEDGPRLKLTGFTDEVALYYRAADAFLLTSREDPFPSVVLEALAAGLPIIGLTGTTGCAELIARFGRLVDRHDLSAICAAIVDAADGASDSAAAEQRQFVRDNFRFDDYCFSLMQRLDGNLPSISVIVPNYNYAHYLPERLSSIFSQTHPVLEVMVLDDCSTDDSLEVIKTIAAEARRDIDLVVNETNSGSVFRQWLRGVEKARGEYVWIAEADDVADERFLEVMAKRIARDEASLAFCDSWQIASDGEQLGNSYRFYMNQIEPAAFDASFALAGGEFMRRFLSVKNIILNVSGVLWRRDALLAALAAAGDQLFVNKVAGDWRLYSEICEAGGNVAYESRALNGHRRHQTSVTHALAAQNHYAEILAMQELIGSRVTLSDRLLQARATHRAEARKVLDLETGVDVQPNAPATPKAKLNAAAAAHPGVASDGSSILGQADDSINPGEDQETPMVPRGIHRALG